MEGSYTFDTIESAVEALKRGEFVVVMDDEDRENEGDLIIAAEFVDAQKIAFLLRYTSGIVCVSMTEQRAEQLDLPPMVTSSTDPKKTAFTVSCDAKGTGTGVSAADRAATIRALADPASVPQQFQRPGHIFPLVARPGGVLERRGHTEAAVELCQLAGLKPVGVLCEMSNDDGTMSRLKECYTFSKTHKLPIITVEALVKHKEEFAKTQKHYVDVLAECEIPIQRGDKYLGVWNMRCYRSYPDGLTRHVALIKGDVGAATEPVLVRVHSECFTSHVIGSRRCDCSQQMDVALEIIYNRGCGVVIYVDGHEGRGIGLHNKIKAYSLQSSQRIDTYKANEQLGFPVDMRKYDTPRAIIRQLGISKISMLSNNPTKVKDFEDMVASVVPVICEPHEHNADYLSAKRTYEAKYAASSPKLQASIKSHRAVEPSPLSQTISPYHPKAQENAKQNTKQTKQEKTPSTQQTTTQDTHSLADTPATDPHLSKEIPIQLPSIENISGLRIGLIRTCWNETLVGSLHGKCKQGLLEYGVKKENIVEDFDVPGSFELPYAAQSLAQSGRVDAVICFGVLIKGETMHFEYISSSVSSGLMQVQLTTGIPVIYGVLNCLTLEQAAVRCGVSQPSVLPQSLAATAIRMASLRKGVNANHTLSNPMVQPCSMA